MNEELCREKHRQIEDKLDLHDRRLNAHSERLDILATESASFKVELKSLCKQLEDLTNTIKWFMGLLGTSFIGFFFYAVQQGILK